MRIVMTLHVCDELEVVPAMLDCHFGVGVDFVIAIDRGSVDGTTGILEQYEAEGLLRLLHVPRDDPRRDLWTTSMARLAATEHEADWVINAEPGEWWWPRRGDLRTVLDDVPPRVSMVAAHRYGFVVPPDDGRPFHERLCWRMTRPLTSTHVQGGARLCHRAQPRVTVAPDGHAVRGLSGPVLNDGSIEVLYIPFRTVGQCLSEVGDDGHAYLCDDERLSALLAAGEVVVDTRIADMLALTGADTARWSRSARG